jgi:hypothetical protein
MLWKNEKTEAQTLVRKSRREPPGTGKSEKEQRLKDRSLTTVYEVLGLKNVLQDIMLFQF